MTPPLRGLAAGLARVVLTLAAATLAACSGAVTDNTPVSAGPLTVTPSTATLFAETPTTFVIAGGTGPYTVTSSNQQVIPLAGSPSNGTLTVTPNAVSAETAVTLTVRDSAGSAAVSATATVKPRTVNNIITVIPSPGQAAACGTSLCAGSDAEVRASLAQNGLPLAQRPVVFEVTSGDVRFITSGPGLPETLSTTATATTDSAGIASVRLRALNNAGTQTALLRIVDSGSGFSQRASVSVVRATDAPLNAQPGTVSFQGVAANTCASNVSADVIVFGGQPPYQVSQPAVFIVSPVIVDRNGGRFTITATGQCAGSTTIAVVDSVGANVTVTASNLVSSAAPPPTLAVSPTTVSLGSCNDSATVALIGGSGVYFAASGNSGVGASVTGTTGVLRRVDGPAPNTTSVQVAFSDGSTTRTVTVELNGQAAGACPASTSPGGLTATPPSITLSDCSTNQSFRVTGGNPPIIVGYSEISNGSSFFYTSVRSSSGTNYFVRRAVGPAPGAVQQSLTITDGNLQVTVPIDFTGAAAGAC